MDPNATLKVSAERLADLASVDPDATPGPAVALRQIGAVRPSNPPPSGRSGPASQPPGSIAPFPSTRPRPVPQPKGSAFGTVMLYLFFCLALAAAAIGLIALAGRFFQ